MDSVSGVGADEEVGTAARRLERLDRGDRADDAAVVEALADALRLARTGAGGEGLPPVAAMEEAIAAGWNGVPDGRCRIAEILTAAGRIEEATAIWEQVAGEYPDDVWVFNNAGIAYACAGYHETGLGYLTRGLELALDSGDPERLVDQLADFRARSLAALDQQADELQQRADKFLAAPPPRTPAGRQQRPVSATASPPVSSAPAGPAAEPEAGRRVALAFAWFPAAAWPDAVTRWPGLPDSWDAYDYPSYCAQLEKHLARYAAAAGTAPQLAPIDIDAYLAWCDHTGSGPAEDGSRAGYAAELARTGRALPWPPERNAPCWCGSGRKYKRCCRAAAQHS